VWRRLAWSRLGTGRVSSRVSSSLTVIADCSRVAPTAPVLHTSNDCVVAESSPLSLSRAQHLIARDWVFCMIVWWTGDYSISVDRWQHADVWKPPQSPPPPPSSSSSSAVALSPQPNRSYFCLRSFVCEQDDWKMLLTNFGELFEEMDEWLARNVLDFGGYQSRWGSWKFWRNFTPLRDRGKCRLQMWRIICFGRGSWSASVSSYHCLHHKYTVRPAEAMVCLLAAPSVQ